MIKTIAYTTDSLDMVRLYLQTQKNKGTPRDYEVRIDDLVVVRRTPDITKFNLFKQALTTSSSEVSFIIYKGRSRKYDKYVLLRQSNGSPDPTMSTQEYINKKVSEALDKERREVEVSILRRKTKTQKVKISFLKKRIGELEARNKGDLQDLLQLASSFMSPSSDQNSNESLNGISDDNLINMITHFRSKFGEKVFAEALGTLVIAENPTLIEPVKVLMNEQLEENEKV